RTRRRLRPPSAPPPHGLPGDGAAGRAGQSATLTPVLPVLPPLFFSPIPAPLPAGLGRLDALAVDNRRGGLRVASPLLARLLDEAAIHFFPGPVVGPLIEVVTHRRPVRKLAREQPPGTPGAGQIQQPVEDRPQAHRWGSS